MDDGSDQVPVLRGRRLPALLAGAGVVIVALVVVVALLATRSSGGTTAAPAPSTSPSPSASSSPTVNDIYKKVGPSVAVIQTAKGALGTGVIVNSSGAVLTADHVIADGSAIRITFADGTKATATVASADRTTDVAVLTPATLPQPIVPATIGGDASVGSAVVAIGNPLGLTYSVSSGVVSGLDRTSKDQAGTFTGLIQFDASANPGSSGGPLLDAKGNVIGIVIAIAAPDAKVDAFAGIAFAVPIGAAVGGSGPSGQGNGPQV